MTVAVAHRRPPRRVLPSGGRRARRADQLAGWAMASPAVFFIGLFGLVPLVWSFVLSFQHSNFQTSPTWAGLSNYRALTHDPVFWQSVRQTLLYTVLFVPITLIGSLLVAAALNRKIRGITVYRLAVFVPVVTSTVATGVIFGWLLDPNYGVVNSLLEKAGLPAQGFFTSTREALFCIVGMTVWGWLGFGTLIFLAGLQSVPKELLEAAAIDGCTRRRAFWSVQVPQLRPVSAFLVVWLTINALQLFDEVYVTTKGGPLHASTVVVYYLYQQAFQFFHAGYAAAIAYVLFVAILALTLGELWLTRRLDRDRAS